ncbi:cobalamin biosynthesis protein [Actinoplanes sp. CA-252034]|uniref:cobalamin biosynthesis protein n=1 Tax=Actinoplanes sp. CA-252034 TaxID=3239906 RepID=UPI003D98A48B
MIVLGLGARGGVALRAPVLAALAGARLRPADVGLLATLDRRAAEARFRDLAAEFGWRLTGFTAAELAAQPAPNPSRRVAAATGSPSVAEAAALLAAGPGAVLMLPKTTRDGVTAAIAGQDLAAAGHS